MSRLEYKACSSFLLGLSIFHTRLLLMQSIIKKLVPLSIMGLKSLRNNSISPRLNRAIGSEYNLVMLEKYI